MSPLTKIKAKIKKIFKNVRGLLRSLYWTRLTSNKSSKTSFTAHILVVDKLIYVELAKVCAESLIFFHPNAKVIFHVDVALEPILRERLKYLFKHKKARTIILPPSPKLRWQHRKLLLILALNGTSDVFLDADLKFNGPLPIILGVTFFVKEFRMKSDTKYAKMISSFNEQKYENASMHNTSFFSFGGYLQENLELSEILDVEQKIKSYSQTIQADKAEIRNMDRISEQITLSLIVENWNIPIYALKDVDGHKDKSFLESSYYGATNSTF